MANDFKIHDVISKEVARRYNARPTITACLNHQYNTPITALGAKSGSAIRVKKAQVLSALETSTFTAQDYVEKETTLDLSNWTQIPVAFTASELTDKLTNPSYMKGWGDEYLQPAIDAACVNVDRRVSEYMIAYSTKSIGTPGTGPTTYQTATQMRAHLDKMRAPTKDRYAVFNPDDAALFNNGQVGLFNPSGAISENYKEGGISYTNGFGFYSSPNVASLAAPLAGAGYLVNGTVTTGDTVLPVDTGSDALQAGRSFTLPSIFEVDPVSGDATSTLKTFKVAVDFAGGAGNITLAEPIISTGPYKNVSALPADNDALTMIHTGTTTYGQNLFFHKDAFLVGFSKIADVGVAHEIDIVAGKGNNYSMDTSGPQYGVAMKLSIDGDIGDLQSKGRLDVKWGIGPGQQEWSGIVEGS